MGRAPAMGELAARHGHPAVSLLLLRRPGDLPAARRARGPRRRPDRGPGPVPGLHARGDHAAVERGPAAVRAAGRVLRRGAVRGAGPDPAPGRVRHLRRPVAVPRRAGGVVRAARRGPGGSAGPHDRGGRGPGAGQRHVLFHDPVRRDRARAGGAGRVPGHGWPDRAAAGGHPAGHGDRVAGRGAADRREQLSQRVQADHPHPGGAHELTPVRAVQHLVLGGRAGRPGRRRASFSARCGGRDGPGPGCSRSWPPPRSSDRPSRPGCTPPRCSTSTSAWAPGSRPSPRATPPTGSSPPRRPGGSRRTRAPPA